MPTVVGVRFKDSGKTYHFDPGELTLAQGDQVIVETVRGQELAKVAYPNQQIGESEVVGELKPVLRRAEAADFERMQVLQQRHDDVLAKCKEKVQQHSLPMRLVKAEYSFDGSRLTFYFTAEKRVDFRMLVRDLARTFKTRIELRQVGPRDEAKLLGGIGPCGRMLCCATFLPDYARVSIKMAKDQDLPLNPSKISGVCGRLLCCLSYEHEQYVQIKGELPRLGAWVQTPQGPGEVVSVNVVKETVTVEVEGLQEQVEVSREQIREASERVGAVARVRAEQGQAAPITRQRRSELNIVEPNSEVLEALELLEQGAVESRHEGREKRHEPRESRHEPREKRHEPREGRREGQAERPAPRNGHEARLAGGERSESSTTGEAPARHQQRRLRAPRMPQPTAPSAQAKPPHVPEMPAPERPASNATPSGQGKARRHGRRRRGGEPE